MRASVDSRKGQAGRHFRKYVRDAVIGAALPDRSVLMRKSYLHCWLALRVDSRLGPLMVPTLAQLAAGLPAVAPIPTEPVVRHPQETSSRSVFVAVAPLQPGTRSQKLPTRKARRAGPLAAG